MSQLTDIIDFIHNDFDHPDVTLEDVFVSLEKFDDLYHNGDQSPISDGEYDALRNYAKQVRPADIYFTGVGSDTRGGKIDLPVEMGSLNQVEIGEIEDWVKKNNLQKERTVISDKMDGTSTLIVYGDGGNSQIAYSRGNGVQGADISRHIFKIKNVPTSTSGPLVIRAEVELTETAFEKLRKTVKSRAGTPYKNARNMVAGLMNSKTNPAAVYKELTVVAYEVIGFEGSKSEQLELLGDEGFQVVDYSIVTGKDLTDTFLAEFLNDRRDNLDYAIDGVVIDVDDHTKRSAMNPTHDTLNPEYSVKYKVADADNFAIATVTDVEWNISKHGYLKPRVCLEPVDLVGVTITHATGFNAAFIETNGIGPGAKVQLTRSGDVIPFITGVEKKAIPCMPGSMHPEEMDWDWDWIYNDAGEKVDAKLNNTEDHEEVDIQKTLDFFMSIEAPHLKEGTIRKMFEEHKYVSASSAIGNMLTHPEATWKRTIGENGSKIFNGLRSKMSNIPLHVLMGSLPFFGRGVGKRKFKKLEIAFGTNALHNFDMTGSDMLLVEGFSDKTVDKVFAGRDEYYEFYRLLPDYVEVAVMEEVKGGGVLDGKKVCITGFRDKDLTTKIEELGGTNQSGVSSKTDILVVKDPTSNSGKAKKARDLGVQIMGIDEFKEYIDE